MITDELDNGGRMISLTRAFGNVHTLLTRTAFAYRILSTKLYLLISILLLLSCSMLYADSVLMVEKAVKALENPRLCRTAEEKLQRLAKSEEEAVQVKARVALARYKRQKGNAQAAFQLVEPYCELNPVNLKSPRIEGFIEGALAQAALNKSLNAYKLLDYAKEHAEGIPGILTRVALADMVEPVPDIDKALAYLKEAVSYGDKWFRRTVISEGAGESEPPKPGHEEWQKLRPEILARINQLERLQRIEKWGLDYVLYLEAQEARKSSDPFATDFCSLRLLYPGIERYRNKPSPDADYKSALEKYDCILQEFPEGVFAEAAGLYRCICLAKLGQVEEAGKGLDEFYKKNPDGLYRGEALKLLGDLWLQDGWDIKKASSYYEAALEWCKKIGEKTRTARLYAVPDKCSEPARAPDDWQKMDEFGIISRNKIPSGAVVNRVTVKWYLDWLEEECEFTLGYLCAVDNKWDEASKHFEGGVQFDPLLQTAQNEGYLSVITRLRGACKKGAFVGEAEENRGFLGKKRVAIMWADLLYLREFFEQAESLYERLYQVAVSRHEAEVAARAGLGLILVASQQNDMETAQKIGKEVTERWPRSSCSPYVLMLCGLACDSGPDCDYTEALKYFRQVYSRYPNSPRAEWARFEEIFRGINSKNLDSRRNWIDKFKKDYPQSKYLPVVTANLKLLEKWAAENQGQEKVE